MCLDIREDVTAALGRLDAALTALTDLDLGELTTPEGLGVLERLERVRRRLPVPEHALLNQMTERADTTTLGGRLSRRLADQLHLTRGEAVRRIEQAADLGPWPTAAGDAPLAPVLAATAAAQRAGELGEAHIKIIRRFLAQLPAAVTLPERDAAEAHLAALATRYRPDQVAVVAERLTDELARDTYTDADRAARRTLTLGRQTPDGMTPIHGWLTPEARATLDAVFARWAAPGMCNPADLEPTLDGTPGHAAVAADDRSRGQRNHDALTALGRAMLASGGLGQHNGLPASIIASASLSELQAGTGKALTGGGSWLPMSDLIRLASHAHLYLRLFDGARELALYHTRRIASPGQRIVLYARDRGCAHPGCDVPGYLTEVHHITDHAITGRTDIDDLSLRCGPDHKLISEGGWKTRKRSDGTTDTVPPPHLDHGQDRVNTYHHPEKLLHNGSGDGDGDDGDGGDDPE